MRSLAIVLNNMHVRQQVLLLVLPHHYLLRQLSVVVKLPIYHLKYKHYNI